MTFHFQTEIQDAWIDYNGHMRDSYYGLVFSLAVDALQDDIGFDAAYRSETGCTIYLLEGHTRFLKEVKAKQRVEILTRVLGVDEKRFHLHQEMRCAGTLAAVSELMEMHVAQGAQPKAAAMPETMRNRLASAVLPPAEAGSLPHRARAMGFNVSPNRPASA